MGTQLCTEQSQWLLPNFKLFGRSMPCIQLKIFILHNKWHFHRFRKVIHDNHTEGDDFILLPFSTSGQIENTGSKVSIELSVI